MKLKPVCEITPNDGTTVRKSDHNRWNNYRAGETPFFAARLLSVLLAVTTLTACSPLVPAYTRPNAPVPVVWPQGPAYKDEIAKPAGKQVVEVPWREFIVDGKLQKLIDLALINNRDLRVAALTIERSRALYQIQRADLLPKIDATGSAGFQRIPETFSSTGRAMTTEQYTIGLGVTAYELDLFGRVGSLKEQALEKFFATGQARRSVQISLISQVAAAYLTLAADRERLQLADKTLISQLESYNLIKRRFEVGVSSSFDLNQARTTVESARVDSARFTALVAQDENALATVVGSPVPMDLLPVTLSETLTAFTEISPGLPSTVLLNRPDILQAEGQLKSANANIGAARAAFFPRITLVSSVGFGSDDLAGLFKPGSFAWKFAPQVTLPLFDGGSNAASLTVAEVDRDIAIAQYEKAIQTAFREVSDALAQRGTIDGQLTAQQSLVDTLTENCRLSNARYEKGVDSHLAVLDSHRSLYAAQQNLIGARLTRSANLVTLFKVLGGGGEGQVDSVQR